MMWRCCVFIHDRITTAACLCGLYFFLRFVLSLSLSLSKASCKFFPSLTLSLCFIFQLSVSACLFVFLSHSLFQHTLHRCHLPSPSALRMGGTVLIFFFLNCWKGVFTSRITNVSASVIGHVLMNNCVEFCALI